MANVSSSNSQGELVPKLRFPGFEGDYKQIQLGDIAERVTRVDPDSNAPIMMISAASGFINQSEKYSRDNAGQSLKKYTLLKKGELAYNHGASKLREFGCCFELKEVAARIPYVYHTFFIEKESASYIALLLNNPKIDQQLKRLVSSSVRMDGLLNISYDEYMTVKLCVPGATEQEKIVSFLNILDSRIEKQRQFIDALKSYKRGALSALFPKIGENTPQYRLSGFEGAWEKHKFRDIGTVSMCKRVFKEETTSEGGIPFYKIGTFGGKPDAFISRDLFELYKEKYPYPQKGDILLSASGTIGRIVEYGGEDAYYQDSNIVWLSHDNTVSNKFLKALYPTVKWDGIEGSTIKRLYNDNFLRTEFMIPSFLEQEALGVIFEEIDNLITHHQHKYDLLLSFKQSLLQQMFI